MAEESTVIMKQIKLVKTLPHLNELFVPLDVTSIYATHYSVEIEAFLRSLKVFKKKELTFAHLLEFLNTITPKTYEHQSSELQEKLYYRRVHKVEQKLDYAVKGDTISIWIVGYPHPVRLEFFGDALEELYFYDEEYGRKIAGVEGLIIGSEIPQDKTDLDAVKISYISATQPEAYIFTTSTERITVQNFDYLEGDFHYPQLFYGKFKLLEQEIANLERSGYEVLIKTKNKDDLPDELLHFHTKKLKMPKYEGYENFIEQLKQKSIPAGFISRKLNLAVFTDRELFGAIYLAKPERTKSLSNNIKRLLLEFEGSIQIGDYVVHEDYGVAVYAGLRQEAANDQLMEYLLLKYDGGDELFVPLHQIEKLTKYIGNENVPPKITRLGKTTWEHVKAKIKKSTSLLARDLIEHFAKREVSEAKTIKKDDSRDYKKFVESFDYVETEDQLRATNEILKDLEKHRPMNRLLVGDVGFGKTEVFMRAAFKIVENGGQVAVLAPTTVLTAQHFTVFEDRFKDFPVTIRYLSRFNTPQENHKIIEELNDGKVDIIVGTHRLLSSDVKFKNLQLVVVDEEQRFGVKQKEKIKQLNYGVHLLSVSATPIPRTLSMALSTIHDISIISQPPKNRKPIHTEIIKDNWNKVATAIEHEVKRGGQIYFVHNEVRNINFIKKRLEELTPGVKYGVGHGQMSADELDKVMTAFFEQKYDCLICTTIIENGIDLPNVNTMIINRAHKFGLSQLYQLRGRVGRSEREAFCYLLYEGKDLKEEVEAQKSYLHDKKEKVHKKYLDRFQALVDNQDLGAGFRIASRDLEIRGAGNLLGEQQSGHIATIGYALYIEILAQEVEKLKELQIEK